MSIDLTAYNAALLQVHNTRLSLAAAKAAREALITEQLVVAEATQREAAEAAKAAEERLREATLDLFYANPDLGKSDLPGVVVAESKKVDLHWPHDAVLAWIIEHRLWNLVTVNEKAVDEFFLAADGVETVWGMLGLQDLNIQFEAYSVFTPKISRDLSKVVEPLLQAAAPAPADDPLPF